MTRLADLIIQFEPELLARHGHHLLPSHVRALGALKACRSRFAPQMLAACTGCHTQRCLPHSCGHRACPHCQHHDSQAWLQRQLQALVPATYFLVTFTLPAQLRALAWHHQRQVYALLMQCAWDTLKTFSLNDKKLAGTPGAVAAGVRRSSLGVATLARGQHLSRKAAAAGLQCRQGLSLAGQHSVTMALQQFGLKLCNQVGQAHHGWQPVVVDVDVDVDVDVQPMV